MVVRCRASLERGLGGGLSSIAPANYQPFSGDSMTMRLFGSGDCLPCPSVVQTTEKFQKVAETTPAVVWTSALFGEGGGGGGGGKLLTWIVPVLVSGVCCVCYADSLQSSCQTICRGGGSRVQFCAHITSVLPSRFVEDPSIPLLPQMALLEVGRGVGMARGVNLYADMVHGTPRPAPPQGRRSPATPWGRTRGVAEVDKKRHQATQAASKTEENLKLVVSTACRPRVFQIALFRGIPNIPRIPRPPEHSRGTDEATRAAGP